ncbi:hypothetical protein [Massilia sp.]|uniref:hypothetical protein n=1 Tax=Massilia sp. TaxID=1882437 RepID=UPI00289B5C91|nr:hypothetical protein [Massilia sp.]
MTDITRRKMLTVLAMAVAAPIPLRAAWAPGSAEEAGTRPVQVPQPHSAIAPPGTDSVEEDPLLQRATEWIGQLRQRGQATVLYPVSRLQREFRIGYMRTCTLANALAQRGEWTIASTDDGTRYALVHYKA